MMSQLCEYISLERDHHLIVACIHFRVAFAASLRVEELETTPFNTESIYNSDFVRRWRASCRNRDALKFSYSNKS